MAEPSELQNIDTSVLDTIKSDQGQKLLETAQKEYPYLWQRHSLQILSSTRQRFSRIL